MLAHARSVIRDIDGQRYEELLDCKRLNFWFTTYRFEGHWFLRKKNHETDNKSCDVYSKTMGFLFGSTPWSCREKLDIQRCFSLVIYLGAKY